MKSILSFLFLSLIFGFNAANVGAAEKRETIEQWRIYSDIETNKPRLAAVLYSLDGEDAALGVRCENRQPELYFMLSHAVHSQVNSALIMKVDGVEIESGQWRRASSGNGAFALNPQSLLRQLQDKQRLVLTYKTTQNRYEVAGFHLTGINDVSRMLENVCSVNLAR